MLPTYPHRAYAAVLGKIIGVYLGRPFEGWSHERIERELGEIRGYVSEDLGQPLVVTDDDISGTFTFLRAIEHYGPEVSSREIGHTWLNYILENRTILWWGGNGMSTEHTAFLRLKEGVDAPASGSIERNGPVVAEQIGAQIFIDGWGLVCPGDPARAADYAARAARVSHDGEAVYAAQVVAAMVAEAVGRDDLPPTGESIRHLLDTALQHIPTDCLIAELIADLRRWHTELPAWRDARKRLEDKYGYDKYGGNCHVIPNHGVIVLALLYSDGSFDEALAVANTSGWDTDCNSGNVGCIMGALVGIDGIDRRWREPVRDRILLPTADAARFVSDAVRETDRIVGYAHRLANLPHEAPDWRYHFGYPGSVQGFDAEPGDGFVLIEGQSLTPIFLTEETLRMDGYSAVAAPALFPGQTVRAKVVARYRTSVNLVAAGYGAHDEPVALWQVPQILTAGQEAVLEWTLPSDRPWLPSQVGLNASQPIELHWLTWDGVPNLTVGPFPPGKFHRHTVLDAVDHFYPGWEDCMRLSQDRGTGLVIVGESSWSDYEAEVEVTPHMIEAAGIAVCVQGLERYVSLELRAGRLSVVRRLHEETVLHEEAFPWSLYRPTRLKLRASGGEIRAWVDGRDVCTIPDGSPRAGAAALLVRGGRAGFGPMHVRPML
jgi:ADP-ribosylglycohydrolase